MPSPKVRMPLAETQMATVLSNADPEGKGRVRVRMNWQTDGMQTGWVRVMTPDGGSSDDVKSNRGFVFIPEVGDQVLLGFRHGDPARPYVMGSLFNGTTGGGGGQGNNCKSLTTRSGSSLKLDDSAGSVTLHDKGGVSMNFDGGGNLSITSKIIHNIMGKGAARKGIDIAGHSGLINTGSDNVLIDGYPAARKGDGFICPSAFHNGSGIIMGGSTSVLINGKPAAKIGDETICGVQALPTVGVKAAQENILFEPMLANQNYSNDSYVRAFGVQGSLTDENANGIYDTFNFDAPLILDTKYNSPNWEPFGEGNGGVGVGVGYSVRHGKIKAGLYGDGVYGSEAEAGITGLHHEANVHIGKEGVLYGNTAGYADVGYAEANAKGEYIANWEEKRIEIQTELGAKAGVARAGTDGTADILGILNVKANVEVPFVAADASVKGGWYLDFDDLEAHINVGGDLALILGLKCDLSVTLSLKPITNFITNAAEYISNVLGFIAPKDGIVLTGSSTVIIGG